MLRVTLSGLDAHGLHGLRREVAALPPRTPVSLATGPGVAVITCAGWLVGRIDRRIADPLCQAARAAQEARAR